MTVTTDYFRNLSLRSFVMLDADARWYDELFNKKTNWSRESTVQRTTANKETWKTTGVGFHFLGQLQLTVSLY